jgi:tripartite-type tricarboxylate transporter receptor subunit TctC
LGGHTDINFGGSAHWAPLYKAGKVNVLAMTTEKRDPRYPDIPTFKEFGYKLDFMQFYWVVAPAKTPDPIIHFLTEAFKKGFSEQGFQEAAENLGGTAAFAGPEDTLKAMDRMDQLVQGVVKKYDLKPQ